MDNTQKHFPDEQDKLYKRIYGGISFSGTRPGYICLVGELRQQADPRFILLDEAENFDSGQLIAKAAALDFYYKPEIWLSGETDKAVSKLLIEHNQQRDPTKPSRELTIIPSRIMGLEKDLFKYCLPKLKRQIGPQGELDISKGKLLLGYLSIIQDSEISQIKVGDYPSAEAAIYCISDLEMAEQAGQQETSVDNSYEMI